MLSKVCVVNRNDGTFVKRTYAPYEACSSKEKFVNKHKQLDGV